MEAMYGKKEDRHKTGNKKKNKIISILRGFYELRYVVFAYENR